MRIGQRKIKKVMTNRKCRGCNRYLPASRYFNCEACQPELPNIDETFLYGLGEDEELDTDWFESATAGQPSGKENEKLVNLIEEQNENLEDYEDELESYDSNEGTPY